MSIGLLFSSHSDKAHQDASQALLHTKLHQEKLQQGKTFPSPCCSIHFLISVTGSLFVRKSIKVNFGIFSSHSYTDIRSPTSLISAPKNNNEPCLYLIAKWTQISSFAINIHHKHLYESLTSQAIYKNTSCGVVSVAAIILYCGWGVY